MRTSIPGKSRFRRAVLGALALATIASPAIQAGCAASFDPPTWVNSLRVIAVNVDPPYAAPGDPVRFTMEYYDGFGTEPRPVNITWLGGCVNPEGDQYFRCYDQFADTLQNIDPNNIDIGSLCDDGILCTGPGFNTFERRISADILTTRAVPEAGPHYGIEYIFFMACAGTIGFVPPDGSGVAPDFPLGCFDPDGKRLGAESFVPGYTQVYTFADERENRIPTATGITFNGEPMATDDQLDKIPTVKACSLTADERAEVGCDGQPVLSCPSYQIKIMVDPSVADLDPDATAEEGGNLLETVWVSYFADEGNITPGTRLVNDAVTGFTDDFETIWTAPAEPVLVTIWAVVRDARGGSSVVRRFIRVE